MERLTLKDAKPCPLCGSAEHLEITPRVSYYALLGENGMACISMRCGKCHLELYNHEDWVRVYETKVERLVKKWNQMTEGCYGDDVDRV